MRDLLEVVRLGAQVNADLATLVVLVEIQCDDARFFGTLIVFSFR